MLPSSVLFGLAAAVKEGGVPKTRAFAITKSPSEVKLFVEVIEPEAVAEPVPPKSIHPLLPAIRILAAVTNERLLPVASFAS